MRGESKRTVDLTDMGALLTPSKQEFRQVLRVLSSLTGTSVDDRIHFVARFADSMESSTLGRRELSQRFTSLVSILHLDGESMRLLAARLSSAPSGVKNLVASALPKEVLPVLYRRGKLPSSSLSPESRAGEQSREGDNRLSKESTEYVGLDNGTVLLLAMADNQQANSNLLNRHRFATIRVRKLDDLAPILDEIRDIYAVVVDSSMLHALQKSEQCALFRELASYSTFLWLRIDQGSLKILPLEVIAILKQVWCSREEVSVNQLSFASEGTIQEPELDFIRSSRRLVSTIERGRFIPGELSDTQTTVLMAVAAYHGRDWRAVLSPDMITLNVQFLRSGRTSAKVVLFRVNDHVSPLIAKIDSQDYSIDEMRRFRTFIEPSNMNLRPTLHIHNGCGVIVFGLVSDDASPTEPARTLEECFYHLWHSEIYDIPGVKPSALAVDLGKAIASISSKILRLNSQEANDRSFDSYTGLSLKPFHRLESTGTTLGFSEQERRARDIAERQFAILDLRAVVHGDVNLRNILVIEDRVSHLIDYASSGPGHPAIDLVWLELALYLSVLQPSGSEEDYRSFQRALSVGRQGAAELRAQFPNLFTSATNQTCLEGCIIARDSALQAVSAHGGTSKDYIAVKFLTAWVSLTMKGLSPSLARAIINALAEEICNWDSA